MPSSGQITLGAFPPFMVEIVKAAALRVYGVAVELGVLAHLGDRAMTAAELVQRCGTEPRALSAVLERIRT